MSELVERVREAERWAKENKDKLVEFALRHKRLAVTYTGLSIIASKIFSHTLRTLIPSSSIIDACIDALTYHVVPYTENLGIMVFTEKGTENSLIRLLDSTYYTGNNVLLITPTPVQIVKSKLRGQGLIVVDIRDKLLGEVLLASISSYEVAKRLRRKEQGKLRFNRLGIEVHDYASIVDELISMYRLQLEELKENIDEISLIAYTPTMEPVAYLVQKLLLERKKRLVPLLELTRTISLLDEKLLERRLVLLFSTTVEEYSVKELLFKSMASKARVLELKIRTDPLTAPVYGLILLLSLSTM